ncbi:splicing factor ATP-dependent RNA helicase [Seminavis robusta]|uniref:RNA helicase n=1 Tax=Seminavis robusta TaxID=568900 RepID=A0A9N8H186_9STRA|nr:splicing factor ATP-dependent RNA helicase [Seminavis robusta]|eukprot:Sro35_g022410.1 splicing factor ATP-dependent RNA helicase (786) ;mRNA; f:93193-95550
MSFWKPASSSSSAYRSSSSVLRDDNEDRGVDAPTFNFSRAPLAQQRMLLPIYKHKRQFLYSMEHYGVVVLVGETGCGKSTQLVQFLYENGWASDENDFQIVCTQPRRIAAQTLAQRVAHEEGSGSVGGVVGYAVRFDDCTTLHRTRIKFVTDGILLREATLQDPLLSSYSVVIVDEAHERNINSDVLLGLLKKIRKRRPDLRVIVCSATIDAEAFLQFFVGNNSNSTDSSTSKGKSGSEGDKSTDSPPPAKKRKSRWDQPKNKEEDASKKNDDNQLQPESNYLQTGTIISVDGRQHAVDVLYLAEPAPDYIKKSVETALEIHAQEPMAGDILCFLPSGEDIDHAIRMAQETLDQQQQQQSSSSSRKRFKPVDCLPLYSALPYQMQARVFQQADRGGGKKQQQRRRIIFSTNMAETSVTVPRITHVVDCGLAKLPYFDPKTGFDRLIVTETSHASARQRTGRAGRVQAGKCHRLYTEKYMVDKMPIQTPPEILRTNLTGFILTLKALGVDNLLSFDLLDLPSIDALSHGLECLYALGAIDDKTNLTKLGMDMSAFPTEPRVARMLLESLEIGCSWEILSVASAMQVRQLFVKPRGGGGQSQQRLLDYEAAMSEVADPSGDHVTYANIIAEHDDRSGISSSRIHVDEDECRERFLHPIALRRALEVRNQLTAFLRKYGKIKAFGLAAGIGAAGGGGSLERSRAIRKCVTAGFFFNVAKLANDGRYYTIRKNILVTPSRASVFHSHGSSSEYIIFCETHDGTRGGIELRSISTIDARWLRELASHYWE